MAMALTRSISLTLARRVCRAEYRRQRGTSSNKAIINQIINNTQYSQLNRTLLCKRRYPWPLIGIAVIVVGFVLRFNPVLVVTMIVTGVAAHMPIATILEKLGEGFEYP